MEYSEVKEQIKQKLPVQKEFGDSENLLELGLSSIVIMRLVNQWRKQGVKVAFGTLMEHPTLKEWWKIIQKGTKKKGKKAKAEKRDIIMERDMRKPFPLTDVQYAYWVGREDNQVLGGIGCHAYLEFDGYGVVPERLQEAWSRIQYHHPMLRASFSENGMQKIESKPYSEKIKINDFSLLTETEAEQEAQAVRRRLSHRKLKIEEGEVAGLELTLLPGNKTRLHIDLDLLIADVQSLQILLRDLAMVYSGVELPEESKDWNFAAYLEQQNVEDREERKKAKEYWSARLKNLPQGPDMPLAKRPEEVKNPVFHRRVVRIGKEEWDCLQRRAKEYQTTPAMLLLTAYSAILERWSKNKSFLIIYCVACCIPAAGETMSDILKGPLHSFASFCAGKIQVVKRFPKILALAIFGNGMNKKQREKLYSSLCGESTNLLFERINECKLETSIKWILPTKDRALNPKQQRVYMNNIGNIKSIIKLTAPHDVMISHPEEVAKILLEN